jgi:hypothetical protein
MIPQKLAGIFLGTLPISSKTRFCLRIGVTLAEETFGNICFDTQHNLVEYRPLFIS